jgi:NAD(P)-dependent dehydrogenase (short-subunit alcohol dehydrogenase family)
MAGLSHLKGKTAVVTGGSSGIGLGLATRFASQGMNVVIAAPEQEKVNNAAARIGAVGFQADVTTIEDVQALAAFTLDRFGAVHVVCNNAGVGPMAPIAKMTLDDWRWMIDVNLYGVIHGVQVFLPFLESNDDGGHIVNTSSLAGLVPGPNVGAYAVTKFGVVALTEVLSMELRSAGSKVGATVLVPGPVRSDIKTSMRTRPPVDQSGLVDVDLADVDLPFELNWKDPLEVGDLVLDCIRNDRLYAVTHPELLQTVTTRHQAIESAFA